MTSLDFLSSIDVINKSTHALRSAVRVVFIIAFFYLRDMRSGFKGANDLRCRMKTEIMSALNTLFHWLVNGEGSGGGTMNGMDRMATDVRSGGVEISARSRELDHVIHGSEVQRIAAILSGGIRIVILALTFALLAANMLALLVVTIPIVPLRLLVIGTTLLLRELGIVLLAPNVGKLVCIDRLGVVRLAGAVEGVDSLLLDIVDLDLLKLLKVMLGVHLFDDLIATGKLGENDHTDQVLRYDNLERGEAAKCMVMVSM